MKTITLAIPMIPLLAAIVAGLFGKKIGRRGAHSVTIGGVAISFLLSLIVYNDVYSGNITNEVVYTWGISGGIPFQIGFLIDQLSATMMVVEIALVLNASFSSAEFANPASHGAEYSNSKALGRVIYTDYVYAFEIAALILLVAIIAAIALTMRKRPDTKFINPGEQVLVNRDDRLRIVKMDAEKTDSGGDGS